jgi:hypothetical protein
MKALTIRQPWAWAIARGFKTVENRGWSTPYRGPLAIHAAVRWDDDVEAALGFIVRALAAQGSSEVYTLHDVLPLSATCLVVAVVDLVDICTAGLDGKDCECGPWAAAGQAHWQLANARPLEVPVPAKGRLGLWDIDLRGAA